MNSIFLTGEKDGKSNFFLFKIFFGLIMMMSLSSNLAFGKIQDNKKNGVDEEQRVALDSFFNIDELPEISLFFSLDDWNKLLTYYDEDKNNNNFVECSLSISNKGSEISIDSIGVRIRGGWSRKRPEGETGQYHVADNTNWHHCSFAVNLNKFTEGKDRKIGGVEKFDLKYFNIDPTYVREPYCYDLFRRYGITTSIRASYCKVQIYVKGDSKPAYYGIYMLMEHIDKDYL